MTTGLVPVLDKLRGRIIVSVQAETHEPFYPLPAFDAMTRAVLDGQAAGLRLAGKTHIRHARAQYPDVPVIGITKPPVIPENYETLVYITPTFADVQAVAEAGAHIVAMDATRRPRPGGETLADMVEKTREAFPETGLMADVATRAEGLSAAELGFGLLTTTLSGYTSETAGRKSGGPDFELLKALVAETGVPVILEGRVWDPAEVERAFELGAFAVVIGSAITRPHLITRRFVAACRSADAGCSRMS